MLVGGSRIVIGRLLEQGNPVVVPSAAEAVFGNQHGDAGTDIEGFE